MLLSKLTAFNTYSTQISIPFNVNEESINNEDRTSEPTESPYPERNSTQAQTTISSSISSTHLNEETIWEDFVNHIRGNINEYQDIFKCIALNMKTLSDSVKNELQKLNQVRKYCSAI